MLIGTKENNKKNMSILDEIKAEREYQNGKWGVVFDDKNTVNDWGAYINVYLSRALTMLAGPGEQREALVQVASLAVAAVETFDRNTGFPARHYDKAA